MITYWCGELRCAAFFRSRVTARLNVRYLRVIARVRKVTVHLLTQTKPDRLVKFKTAALLALFRLTKYIMHSLLGEGMDSNGNKSMLLTTDVYTNILLTLAPFNHWLAQPERRYRKSRYFWRLQPTWWRFLSRDSVLDFKTSVQDSGVRW